MTSHYRRISFILAGIVGLSASVNIAQSQTAQDDNLSIPVNWCDDAVIVSNERVIDIFDSILDFDALAVETRTNPATLYVYLDVARNDEARITAFAGTIDCWQNLGIAISSIDNSLTIEIGQIDYTADQYKKIRRLIFEHIRSGSTNAIFKITGRFERYSGSFEPYFRGQSVELHMTTDRW